MRILVGAALLIVVSATGESFGQQYNYQGKAATVGESHARGLADVVRAAGAANLKNSEAANNYEAARSKNFDNRIQYTKMYFEKRRMNREYREAEKGPRPSAEDLFRLAKKKSPRRLTDSDLDPVTGRIEWPPMLRDRRYDVVRGKVDALFQERAKGAADFARLDQAIKEFREAIRANISQHPPQMYGQAVSFLQRMAYEIRF